jgi:hypothetical protein
MTEKKNKEVKNRIAQNSGEKNPAKIRHTGRVLLATGLEKPIAVIL